MTTRRTDLASRMSAAATRRAEPDAPAAGKAAVRTKDARITLNLPPQLYRDLMRWCDTSAEALDVPRVGVQEALRGFVREITSNPALSAMVIHSVRDELRG